ncbi:Cl- channel CLC-3 and related proteins (CLC superfamily) [Handroanthus impetiginosus]|uniref:Chloride channel protein n=1 Tax=Handroanthus impetiginosus TaxID=429701 RepID=A0A2G9H6Q1_9LAMI|nr:Cl- channel CLC-3 and related proteins (CLC superfamily) [Handroanthus impetiginosus]
MHFGLAVSTTCATTNSNVIHPISCASSPLPSLHGNCPYRYRVPCSSSSTKAMSIHAAAVACRHPSPPINFFLACRSRSYTAPFNRRRCVGLRQYRCHSGNNNGKYNIGRPKAEELDDDPPQPMIISSLAAPYQQEEEEEEKEPIIIIPGPDADDDDDESLQLHQLGNSAILSACFVGLFTGVAVVLFNYTVHEIRDFCWGGIPDRGASWLREEPIKAKWERVILVPAFGGLIVSMLNMIRTALKDSMDGTIMSNIKSTLKPILKTVAACITLGTGNSLGPEGPSVEIGVAVAKGVGTFFDKGAKRKLSLRAAGSAAGISSGFNAAVAGCFFAVESVLWPSPSESSLSLTNTTSMVILSAVIASVISEIGLGSEPAFGVPVYDFRSPSELPLYLLLGTVCGLVSVGLSKSTSFMLAFFDGVQRAAGIPKAAFPVFGGLTVGLIALAYPEILYWGFQNVDTLLESRPFASSLSADLLLQLVAVKIVATSLSRASGLVGGYYAPSLFIGAATGMAYGKIVGHLISMSNPIFHLSIFEVASPQAYGLVGMAATLAGVCQVPLTAVLLLFELTQDYRIVLPLLGAVGLSSWITSDKTRKKATDNTTELKNGNDVATSLERYSYDSTPPDAKEPNGSTICELESSLCLNDDSDDDDADNLADEILVSQAMRIKYVKTSMSTSLKDVVSLMLEEKQSCAVIVDENNWLIGQLTLNDIQQFIEFSRARKRKPQVLRVSDLCSSSNSKRCVSWTATPNMSLLTALTLMNRHGINQLPVISESEDGSHAGCPVGLLDRESINFACRAFAIREDLSWFFMQ